MRTRREFVQLGAATGTVLGLGIAGCGPASDSDSASEPTPDTDASSELDILILGGTGFIGPHMVEYAVSQGHKVTLFNRGKTNADLFPGVETLIGDRDGKLDALNGRRWDAVIDNSGYVPRHVRDSATLLRDAVGQYLFISSISAYADFEAPGIDEDYRLGEMSDPTVEEVTNETYGPMKALCEAAVQQAMPNAATIVRPGYIVGPGDRTDRWTYWPVRVAAGGTMLAPGAPTDHVQFIDARDLARFVVGALETGTTGEFNAVGPGKALTMGGMLDTMREVTGVATTLEWFPAGALEENNVSVPIWAPSDGEYAGVHRVSNARAVAAGMTFTGVDRTVRDTLDWWNALEAERRDAMRSGLRVDGDEGSRPAPMSLAEQMALESRLLASLAG